MLYINIGGNFGNKKIKISLLEFLIFVKKTDIFVLILKAKKKAVTDEVRIAVPTSSTKRYLLRSND